MTKISVGIDVSKHNLDIACLPGDSFQRLPNNTHGINTMLEQMIKLNPQLIVMESTGKYHLALYQALQSKTLPAVVVNPRQVRDFAKASGRLAKTDKLDARVIARFGQVMEVKNTPLISPATEQLRELMVRREQLLEMKVMESNRMECVSEYVCKSIEKHIAALQAQIKELEAAVEQCLAEQPALAEADALMQTIPGVGRQCAATLLAYMPELGKVDRKSAASLAGLAPISNESGRFKGKRSIRGGRPQARKALYMAALSASRYNPAIKEFYNRLKEKGKPGKVAIVACMRKLLVIINTMLKNNTAWLQQQPGKCAA